MYNNNLECSEVLVSRIYDETQHANPLLVAEAYGISVKVVDLPDTVMAIYTMVGTRSFIVLNELDNPDMHPYATALALYYYFTNQTRILLRDGPSDGNFNAAHFAYALMQRSEELDYLEQFIIPEEIMRKAKGRLM